MAAFCFTAPRQVDGKHCKLASRIECRLEPEHERQGPTVAFIVSLPDGTQRQTSFEEAQKRFATFPIEDTSEPPAEEGKSSDARHAEWLLERQFPHEFALYDRRPIPIE